MEQKFPKKISVVIVSYNVRHVLGNCLDSLQIASKAFESSGGTVEVLVVDNDSQDGTVASLKSHYSYVNWLAAGRNLGFGAACNIGSSNASGSLLLFLNPDTLVQQNTLVAMWEFMQETPNVGVAGCKVVNTNGSLQLACRRSFPSPRIAAYQFLGLSKLFPNSPRFGRYNLTYLDENQANEVDAVSGSFMFMRAELYRKVKGFDEDFFMYGEDLDLCYRIQLEGKKNYYTPCTQVVHFKGESAKSRPLRSRYHFYSAMIIFSKKHLELRMLPMVLFALGAIVLSFVNFVQDRWRKWPRWILDMLGASAILAGASRLYLSSETLWSLVLSHWKWYAALSGLIWLSMGLVGDYRISKPSLKQSAQGAAWSVLGFFALGYFFYEDSYSRVSLGLAGVGSFFFLLSWRWWSERTSLFIGKFLSPQKRVAVVGMNSRSMRLRDLILSDHLGGYEFIGFMSHEPEKKGENTQKDVEEAKSKESIGKASEIPILVKQWDIQQVIFTLEESAYADILKLFSSDWPIGLEAKILVGEPKATSICLMDINLNKQESRT
jgi:GT2 family glycosyltransferase